MAHIHFKKHDYLPFEERLAKAVLCPFTMGGAAPFYKKYWELATSDNIQEAHERKMKYDEIIRTYVVEAKSGMSQHEDEKLGSRNRQQGTVSSVVDDL